MEQGKGFSGGFILHKLICNLIYYKYFYFEVICNRNSVTLGFSNE